jgi:hypothetical protein
VAGVTLAIALVLAGALWSAGAPSAGLVVIGAGWLVWRRAGAGIARARAGDRAEKEVAVILRRLRPEALLFDVRLPGMRGDVDAVVLGPMCATVEVKRAHGRVRLVGDGGVVVGGRRVPGAPLRQALAAAVATRRTLDIDATVEAVLCVTGARGRARPVSVGNGVVWLTSARRLRRTLRRLPRVLDRRTARSLVARLE